MPSKVGRFILGGLGCWFGRGGGCGGVCNGGVCGVGGGCG